MKNKIKNISNLFFVIIIVFFLFQRIPMFIKNKKLEGQTLNTQSYPLIKSFNTQESTEFPLSQKNSIAIFWATWCAPCKIEMNRLEESVKNNKINKDQIFAINPYEDKLTIIKFLNKTPYPFTFIEASELGEKLSIELTPTTVYFEKNNVNTIKTGLSLIGIWQAEYFLKN